MPFMSYEVSVEQAVINAGRLMKEGRANAVKLEGGVRVAEQIKAITKAGIPVCAHIGLTPQSVNAFGGFKVQGKTAEAAQQMVEDALAVQEQAHSPLCWNAFPQSLPLSSPKSSTSPPSASVQVQGCDGQVLVYQDMLALFSDFKPKFVKHFGNIGPQMTAAFKAYDEEVKAGTFPSEEHTFKIDEEALEKLY